MRSLGAGGPQSVLQLAGPRPVSRQLIQTLMDGMMKDGLVTTAGNPAHRKSWLVVLSTHGRRELKAMQKREAKVMAQVRLSIPAEVIEQAASTLSALRSALESTRGEIMWKETIDLRRQFGHPHGWPGSIAGHLMALRNGERSRWVLSLLEVRPGNRVLEAGFRLRHRYRRMADRVREGMVAGIDHSKAMLREASIRNDRMMRAGRVQLLQAGASQLPFGPD